MIIASKFVKMQRHMQHMQSVFVLQPDLHLILVWELLVGQDI